MSDIIIKSLQDCLSSLLYSCTSYDKLAEKTQDESARKLLISYATEEKHCFDLLCAHYIRISDGLSFPVSLPDITVYDFYKSLLECITCKISDIDKYKNLISKTEAGDLRNLFLRILQCKVRQGFGLLVLITPEELYLQR